MQLPHMFLALSLTMSQLVNAWAVLQMRLRQSAIMCKLLHESETCA